MLYSKAFFKSDDHEWVVFLHGVGGSSSIWFKQLRDFRQKFNVLLIDLRGHGKSQNSPKMKKKYYTLHDVSEDVIQVMEELNIEKAHFVGISIGTVVIRTIADMEPQRIQSMIMGGAITKLNTKSKFLFNFGNVVRHFMPYMWLYKLFAYIVMPMKAHAESRSIFIKEAQKACHDEFVKWYRLIARDMQPFLLKWAKKETGLPTLYIMGEQDHMFLPQVKQLVQKHTSSILQIITGSGHVCNVDKADTFNAKCIEFIKRHSLNFAPVQ